MAKVAGAEMVVNALPVGRDGGGIERCYIQWRGG